MDGVITPLRPRYLSALIVTVTGALLAVGAFTFSANTQRWLGLAVGGGDLALLLCVFALTGRGRGQRLIDAVLAPVLIWTLVAGRTIELAGHGGGPHLVRWLSFSAGAAIAGLGMLSLLLHELSLERDLLWAAERLAVQAREERVAVHDFRDTDERDADALPRAFS